MFIRQFNALHLGRFHKVRDPLLFCLGFSVTLFVLHA